MSWALLWIVLATASAGGVLLLWDWGVRRTTPKEIPEFGYWRIRLPRNAQFSVDQAAAWLSALEPSLVARAPQFTLEITSRARELSFYLTAPLHWEPILRGQLAAWFPHAQLEREEPLASSATAVSLALTLHKSDIYPLRIPEAGQTDPLLGVCGILTAAGSACGLRLAIGSTPWDWRWWAPAAAAAVKSGRRPPPRGIWLWILGAITLLAEGLTARAASPSPTSNHPVAPEMTAKVTGPVFHTHLAVWAEGKDVAAAKQRAIALATQLRVGYRDPFGNRLIVAEARPTRACARSVPHSGGPGCVLGARELAGLFHVPSGTHPLVRQSTSRHVDAPPLVTRRVTDSVPSLVLGEARVGEHAVRFGLQAPERRFHTYVIGKTGTGKSTFLANIARQDLEAGRGMGLIDPHGDLAEQVLSLVPPHRKDDLLYFDAADPAYPIAFNLLAAASPAQRPLVASGVVGVFKKLYGDSWGPRLEYILRNAILALLEGPAPSLLALPRLLTDRNYRHHVMQYVHDPLLRTFFTEEYERYDPRWRTEAISPILNKVGQFLASSVVRHIVGQSRSGFSLRAVMDRSGIFIANLASGKIGEDNSDLLGGLLVAGFQLAAMSRADQPEAERRDFHLLVDEFQHFANDAFASILSEARKYRLTLTLSHQYLDQVPASISDAIFGNVGTLAAFRVGATDTARLAREFQPTFDAQDLVNLPNHQFCVRLAQATGAAPAFSARTILVPPGERPVEEYRAHSREKWARPRAEVELEIADLWEGRTET